MTPTRLLQVRPPRTSTFCWAPLPAGTVPSLGCWERRCGAVGRGDPRPPGCGRGRGNHTVFNRRKEAPRTRAQTREMEGGEGEAVSRVTGLLPATALGSVSRATPPPWPGMRSGGGDLGTGEASNLAQPTATHLQPPSRGAVTEAEPLPTSV